MYLLSCPNCQTDLPITPAQAGDSVLCPECQGAVSIPKLGELRRLPQAEDASQQAPVRVHSTGGTIAFVVFSMFAVAALMGAGYNAIRWGMIETETTTETHLEEIDIEYRKVDPVVMVMEFENMEKNSLDLIVPYKYQAKVDEKAIWGRNALVAGGVMLICGIGAVIAASQRRTE